MPTYALTADLVPIPTGPLTAASQSGCTATTTTAPTIEPVVQFAAMESEPLNVVFAALYTGGAFGGKGHGIISGLTLTLLSGLSAQIDIGEALIGGQVEAASAIPVVLPDATAHCYVWLKQDGTAEVVANSITPPQNDAVFVGSCVTAAGVASAVDSSGVCYLDSGLMYRTVADLGAPNDVPGAKVHYLTKTGAGLYLWTGTAYQPLGAPVNAATLAGTYTLNVRSAGVQSLDPDGADRTVTVPASPVSGSRMRIVNSASSGTSKLIVKDSGSTETLCTLYPGDAQDFLAEVGGESASAVYRLANRGLAQTAVLIAASLVLSWKSAKVQRITCASQQKVLLPAVGTITFDTDFEVWNDNAGGGFNVLLRDSGDTTTIATLTPGDAVSVPPIVSAGAFAYPSTLTPAPPT